MNGSIKYNTVHCTKSWLNYNIMATITTNVHNTINILLHNKYFTLTELINSVCETVYYAVLLYWKEKIKNFNNFNSYKNVRMLIRFHTPICVDCIQVRSCSTSLNKGNQFLLYKRIK